MIDLIEFLRFIVCNSSKYVRTNRHSIRTFKIKQQFFQKLDQKIKIVQKSDFQMLQVIGDGGFSIVRLAKNLNNNKYYAIKIMSKSEQIERKQTQHNFYEIRLQSMIDNKMFVKSEGFFQDRKFIYIVMEYVPGSTLFTQMKQNLSQSHIKFYAANVVLILEYLHKCLIVHRDIKPENLLISQNGYLKLSDFGLSKLLNQKNKFRTYTLCGTPNFMSPEIIQGKGHGFATDYWSLGILIYELLFKIDPFNNEDPMVIYQNICEKDVIFPLHSSVTSQHLIQNLLQKQVTLRYGNMSQGANQIKEHRFFKDINWIELEKQKSKAPYIPKPINPKVIACKQKISKFKNSSILFNDPYKNPQFEDINLFYDDLFI